jgi:hypothetical protein
MSTPPRISYSVWLYVDGAHIADTTMDRRISQSKTRGAIALLVYGFLPPHVAQDISTVPLHAPWPWTRGSSVSTATIPYNANGQKTTLRARVRICPIFEGPALRLNLPLDLSIIMLADSTLQCLSIILSWCCGRPLRLLLFSRVNRWVFLLLLGFPPGKTMNSWWFYHYVMNTLPALPGADKRSLAPPDLFPHK